MPVGYEFRGAAQYDILMSAAVFVLSAFQKLCHNGFATQREEND
jgi:hypothetical protein